MKKKHLKSLTTIENWLKKQDLLSDEAKSSIAIIKEAISLAPEEEKDGNLPLPAPQEISGEVNTLAFYSDGGCRGNPGPGAYAFVVQDHSGKIITEGVGFDPETTNNKMELSGPLEGLGILRTKLQSEGKEPLLTKIKVMTDSKYVVEGMKSWVAGWKGRGWKKADGKAPENLELWQGLDRMRGNFLEIEWVWVKGHGGHPQNEYCDRKANEAMDAHII